MCSLTLSNMTISKGTGPIENKFFCIFVRPPQGDLTISLRFYGMFCKYKYLTVNSLFSHLVFLEWGVRNRRDSSRTSHGLRTISTLSLRTPYDFRMISLRSAYSSDSERRQKPGQGILRWPYELLTYTVTNVVAHDHLRCLKS